MEVNILDPACGSGSFLTRAFQEIANVIEERLKKGESSKKYQSFQSHNGRLSLGQKATILLNCIYGVDLDEKAVELAQLNLLLKLLEDETPETKRRILPNMKDNIKNGNSLIDDDKVSNRAFNWNAQFPDVFRNGGFDVVVGNPPYVNIFNIKERDRSYFQKNFETATNKSDLYAFFIERIIKNLLKDNGYLGFIISNTWTSIQSFENLRKLILNKTLVKKLIPLEMGTFADATVVPIILICRANEEISKIAKNNINVYKIINKEFRLNNEIPQINFLENNGHIFSFSINLSTNSIFEKLKMNTIPLGEIANFSLGIKTSNNENLFQIQKKILFQREF